MKRFLLVIGIEYHPNISGKISPNIIEVTKNNIEKLHLFITKLSLYSTKKPVIIVDIVHIMYT